MRNLTLLEELQAACNAIETTANETAKPVPHEEAIGVGDIVYNSWGWEQTNIDFYVVTRRTASTVNLCPIASKVVETTQYMSEKVVADTKHAAEVLEKYGFTTNVSENGLKGKRVRNHDGFISIKMKHGYCGRWDGKELTATYYA